MVATDAAREPGAPGGGPVDESALGRPGEGLRPFIASYTGYSQAGVAPAWHAGLPSPRDFAARHPEGNRWSFGTYSGEPRKSD